MARKTKEAFKWVIKILCKHKVPFQIAGGFAARIYGSHRKLADIDIGVPDSKLKKILSDVRKYVIYGPKRYLDKNFDLQLMTLKYRGQEIDLYGTDKTKLYDRKHKKWTKDKTYFKKSMMKSVYGIKIPVIPKKELMEYKKILGRKVDLADVKALTKH
jgi:hypothetical protein